MAEHSVATPGLHRLCVAIGAGPDTQISELLIVTGGPWPWCRREAVGVQAYRRGLGSESARGGISNIGVARERDSRAVWRCRRVRVSGLATWTRPCAC